MSGMGAKNYVSFWRHSGHRGQWHGAWRTARGDNERGELRRCRCGR